MAALIRALAIVAAGAISACLIAPTALCDGDYDFDTPTAFDTAINTGVGSNDAPFLTRDRDDLYYNHDEGGLNGDVVIYHAHRDSPAAAWSPGARLPFTQRPFTTNPYVTPDGNTLYFDDQGLHRLDRTPSTGQFDGSATLLDHPAGAGAISLTDDQLDMYFEHDPGGNQVAIYHAHRGNTAQDFPIAGTRVEGLDALGEQLRAPSISSDGTTLVFATIDQDLYLATGSGDVFAIQSPMPIQPASGTTFDGSITDDTIIVFASGGFDPVIKFVERACHN